MVKHSTFKLKNANGKMLPRTWNVGNLRKTTRPLGGVIVLMRISAGHSSGSGGYKPAGQFGHPSESVPDF
ncbi:hypothetical protein IEQ34_022477 [Dendrobium chrysotoxum]|uniref:Uncharacterized protein n=1 Tax=Dendrobium chrysotoxum TaxID=161865 RepID=A0AAV7FXT1_DENCH|nr:hypothetical protein IEQ34_022477 [Dendrobium chrysotoxum]